MVDEGQPWSCSQAPFNEQVVSLLEPDISFTFKNNSEKTMHTNEEDKTVLYVFETFMIKSF